MTVDPAILLRLRPRMLSVAYRMLGGVTDADAVQYAGRRGSSPGCSARNAATVRCTPRRSTASRGWRLLPAGPSSTSCRCASKAGVPAVYVTLNPDKLSRWSVAEVE